MSESRIYAWVHFATMFAAVKSTQAAGDCADAMLIEFDKRFSKPCSHCNGTGCTVMGRDADPDNVCRMCNGTKRVTR